MIISRDLSFREHRYVYLSIRLYDYLEVKIMYFSSGMRLDLTILSLNSVILT